MTHYYDPQRGGSYASPSSGPWLCHRCQAQCLEYIEVCTNCEHTRCLEYCKQLQGDVEDYSEPRTRGVGKGSKRNRDRDKRSDHDHYKPPRNNRGDQGEFEVVTSPPDTRPQSHTTGHFHSSRSLYTQLSQPEYSSPPTYGGSHYSYQSYNNDSRQVNAAPNPYDAYNSNAPPQSSAASNFYVDNSNYIPASFESSSESSSQTEVWYCSSCSGLSGPIGLNSSCTSCQRWRDPNYDAIQYV
jgi:hypothetical protein